MVLRLLVLSQCQRVTDGQTDTPPIAIDKTEVVNEPYQEYLIYVR